MTGMKSGLKMAHESDPADVVRNSVGDLSGFELFHNLLLVGVYQRPEKTAGGIFITPKAKDEEIYQGTVGLVLKVGPAAFKDDDHNKFHGQSVQPGDWIVFRTSDTQKTSVNGTICRLLEDGSVKARISHPDVVF